MECINIHTKCVSGSKTAAQFHLRSSMVLCSLFVAKHFRENCNGMSLWPITVIGWLQGDTLASCDSMGVVKLWDVRKNAVMVSVKVGPHPANKVAFDPSGQTDGMLITLWQAITTLLLMKLASCHRAESCLMTFEEPQKQPVKFRIIIILSKV